MATAIRPIGHEDRLSIVEHLDELRKRLMIIVAVLGLSFAVCFWQNHALLRVVGHPLKTTTAHRTKDGKGPLGQIYLAKHAAYTQLTADSQLFTLLSKEKALSPATRAAMARQAPKSLAVAQTVKGLPPNLPITLGVGEPFFATAVVAMYFALLLAMPLVLWQIYAFLLPAFSPEERRIAIPLMSMVPVLFICGVVFGFLVVLPAATSFLQNFNSDQFNVLVQANQYYKFAALLLLAMGMVFQLPAGILTLSRMGVVDHKMLSANRRYAILVLTVLAAALPGVDPVSMLIELVPLLVLYEISILLARFFGKPAKKSILNRWAWDDEDEEDDEEDGDALP